LGACVKKLEHADFFTRAKGILTTVYNPSLTCLQAQTPFDKAYMQKRMDLVAERALLQFRYRGILIADERGKKTEK
jgi:hypothetical protein